MVHPLFIKFFRSIFCNLRITCSLFTSIAAFMLSFTHSNANAQWMQTNGPFDHTKVSGIFPADSFLVVATQGGYFSKQLQSENWVLDTTIIISVYTQIGDSLLFVDNDSLKILLLNDPFSTPVSLNVRAYGNILAHSDSCLYGGGSGFYKSSDWGTNWSYHTDSLPGDSIWIMNQFCCMYYEIFAIDVTTNYIFCGTPQGVYRNTANIGTWTAVNNGLPLAPATMIKSVNDTLFTVIGNDLYTSIDYGASWNLVFAGPSHIISFFKSDIELYAGTDSSGIYFSGDNGLNWNALNTGLTDSTVTAIAYYDSTLICGTNTKGILIQDGGQWVPDNNGLICSHVGSMVLIDSALVACTPHEIFISDLAHSNWRIISPSTPHKTWVRLCNMGDTLVLSAAYQIPIWPYFDNYILYSPDKGVTWNSLYNQPPYILGDAYHIYCTPGRIYSSNQDMVYYTDNLGQTWNDISHTMPNCYLGTFIFRNSILYGGSCDSIAVMKYENSNWIPSGNGIPPGLEAESFSACDGQLYVFMNNHEMYVSLDGGDNWNLVGNSFLPGYKVPDYAEYASSLLVSSDNGLFVTSDSGQSWYTINNGLKKLSLGPVIIFNDTLYAGTRSIFLEDGNGVWKLPLNSLHIGIPESSMHGVFQLSPNPFSSTAVLRSPVPLHNATLCLFNSFGQSVGEINNVNGRSVSLQRKNLSSGMYFVLLLQDNKIVGTEKFIITD